jgi:hypothetical protein
MSKLLSIAATSIVLDLLAGWGLMLGLGNMGISMSYWNAVLTGMAFGVVISSNTALNRTIKFD